PEISNESLFDEPKIIETANETIKEEEQNFIVGITGLVINDFQVEDLEYSNTVSVYVEKDFSGTEYKVGDIVYLDPTLRTINITDVSLDTQLINITAENNFTHLSISTIYPYTANQFGLTLYLPFDVSHTILTSINTTFDYTKWQNNGSVFLNGSGKWNATGGIFGGGYEFDGDGDYVNMTNSDSLNLSKYLNYTVTIWLKPNTNGTPYFLFEGDTERYLWVTENGSLASINDNLEVCTSNLTLTNNVWNFAVLSRDNSSLNFYLNGKRHAFSCIFVNPVDPKSWLRIGGNSTRGLNGSIDEVMVFNNVSLSSAQILDIYNNQSRRFNYSGTQGFSNQSALNISKGYDKVKVTGDAQNYSGSSINLTLGFYNGSWQYTDAQVFDEDNEFTINNNSANLTLNFTFYPGNLTDPFYSPILYSGVKSLVIYVNDTKPPEINITSPINNTNSTDNGLDIEYNVIDDNVDSCWYSNDTYSINKSLGSDGACVNITNITWSLGLHNLTVYANDTLGNENSSSVSFNISAASSGSDDSSGVTGQHGGSSSDSSTQEIKKEIEEIKEICGNRLIETGEECDDGNKIDNDGCSSQCKKEELGRVFVSSEKYTGNLGGIYGADEKCQNLALKAGLQGSWIAILSDSNIDARDRVVDPPWPLYNMRDELVAISKEDLWDGSIENPIKYDEYKGEVNDNVWTGTFPDGTRDVNAVCENWFVGDSKMFSENYNSEEGYNSGSLDDSGSSASGSVSGFASQSGYNCKDQQSVCMSYSQCDAIGGTRQESCETGFFKRPVGNYCCKTREGEGICGNGIKEGSEQCDDGNLINGDGCSSLCLIENIKPIPTTDQQEIINPQDIQENQEAKADYGAGLIKELVGRFGISIKTDEEWVSKGVTECRRENRLYCVSSDKYRIRKYKIKNCRDWSECKADYNIEAISEATLTGLQTRECSYDTGEIVVERKECELKVSVDIKKEEDKLKIFDLKDNLILIINPFEENGITKLNIDLFLEKTEKEVLEKIRLEKVRELYLEDRACQDINAECISGPACIAQGGVMIGPCGIGQGFIPKICCLSEEKKDWICGNGIIEGLEQCDDLNNADGDGCSSYCLLERNCGNNIIEPGEQ
ncbi:MAG: DUF4215 domain-containing protein, partial [Nanoarchaeota archaeon]